MHNFSWDLFQFTNRMDFNLIRFFVIFDPMNN